jgi:hypothetical protein
MSRPATEAIPAPTAPSPRGSTALRPALLVLTLLAVAPAADAGAIGRAEFISRADNICQPQRNDAKRRIAHGVRLLTKKHPRVQAAGREFMRAWREVRGGYMRVARLPRPAGYRQRIAKWLRREHAATALGVRSGRALRRKHLARARRLSHDAEAKEQDAKRPVRNFDFHHCRPL